MVVLGLGLAEVYYLAVTLFQFGLAGLVVAAGRLDRVRVGFTVVLAAGGLQTGALFAVGSVSGAFGSSPAFLLDAVIIWTLAFLVTQFPSPFGGTRGKRVAWYAWLAVILAVLPALLAFDVFAASRASSRIFHGFREIGFTMAMVFLAVHLVPSFLGLEVGPLRNQTLAAGAGLAMSGLNISGWWAAGPIMGLEAPGALLGSPDFFPFRVLTIFFASVAVVRLGYGAFKQRSVASWVLFGLLVGAVLLGVRQRVMAVTGTSEVAVQVVRPVLLAVAMLRYDLFSLPEPLRKAAVPVSGLMLAVILFLFFSVLFHPEGLAGGSLDPVSAVVAVSLVALAGVAARAWVDQALPQAGEAGGGRAARLNRYRLAMERARAGSGSTLGLRELREQLGIAPEEHAMMAHVLDERALVPAHALRAAQAGDIVGGRYAVERELGAGGHGRALLAWDEDEERHVVLKAVVNPWEEAAAARQERLEHELAVAAAFEDAGGLAKVHGLVEAGPRLYLVREYVPGRTLDTVVEDQGPLPTDEASTLMQGVAESLSSLHREGLLHLDLKPENLVLTQQERPVIIDFGTVQTIPSKAGGLTVTMQPGEGKAGTLAWMAPEQLLDDPVSPRTDVFALGALTYFLTTGRLHVPVADRSRFEVEDEIVNGSPPTDAPPPIAQAVHDALARDPDKRPADAEAFKEMLEG